MPTASTRAVPPPRRDRHQTAISVGRQPTFYASRPFSLVEAPLLDFQGDLYDEVGTVELVARLRGQEKFSSIEALIDQMSSDVDQTRRTLAGRAPSRHAPQEAGPAVGIELGHLYGLMRRPGGRKPGRSC